MTCFHPVAVRRPTSLPLMRVFAALSLAVCEEYVPPRAEPFTLPVATNALGERWLPRIADLPEALHETAYHSINRLIDYQDEAYARSG